MEFLFDCLTGPSGYQPCLTLNAARAPLDTSLKADWVTLYFTLQYLYSKRPLTNGSPKYAPPYIQERKEQQPHPCSRQDSLS
ncbi:hypothetical protein pdam_00015591 [Pocillopora damicornis]|uniref:Uncharacterized protein n=1 Tax=Pocillopora damicornis TaxID=46731 RepID=A0A3M6TDM2_POCDA|nr:hypothetical protein pdam_00015591 [Pocillopora damicornis]